jgi:hypothetical protein
MSSRLGTARRWANCLQNTTEYVVAEGARQACSRISNGQRETASRAFPGINKLEPGVTMNPDRICLRLEDAIAELDTVAVHHVFCAEPDLSARVASVTNSLAALKLDLERETFLVLPGIA